MAVCFETADAEAVGLAPATIRCGNRLGTLIV